MSFIFGNSYFLSVSIFNWFGSSTRFRMESNISKHIFISMFVNILFSSQWQFNVVIRMMYIYLQAILVLTCLIYHPILQKTFLKWNCFTLFNIIKVLTLFKYIFSYLFSHNQAFEPVYALGMIIIDFRTAIFHSI